VTYLSVAAILLAAFTTPATAQGSAAPERLAPLTSATSEINPVITRTYLCERGARVPAAYINDSTSQRVVLMLEGRMVVMSHVASADGAKYAEDGEGEAGYVWWTKGSGAMLEWIPEDGESQTLLSGCQEE
jgi:Predicted periplasmic protein